MEGKLKLPAIGIPAAIVGVVGIALVVIAFATMSGGKDDKKTAAAKAPAPPAATIDVSGVSPAASNLRTALNVVFAEHVALACDATAAALGARTDEFNAAAAQLDNNSVALAKIVGSAYGPDAEAAFLLGWRNHIGMFVDYTNAVANHDAVKKAKAEADLHQYAIDVAALFNKANGLPNDAVIKIVDEHIKNIDSVIDAQAAKDAVSTYSRFRVSVGQMQSLGDPLADATVKKFPDKFAPKP